MLSFRKILFPVDFSSRCQQATPYVAAIARKFKSEITLLHAFGIYDGMSYGAASPSAVYAAYEQSVRRRRSEELEAFGRENLAGLAVTRVLESGDAASRITQHAEQDDMNLIIMPTHGHGTFRQLLLGSVTSKVLHDTQRPIWTTAHSEGLAPNAFQEIRNIVCAVDLCSNAVQVIRAAHDVASQYSASVRLVHAIPYLDLGRGVIEDAPFERFLFDTATERLEALQREAETEFESWVKPGQVSSVIRDSVSACDAQLVVIGRGRLHKALGRLITSVSAIIRESPCPVLSV